MSLEKRRWEYAVFEVDRLGYVQAIGNEELGEYLNSMGNDGWELVSLVAMDWQQDRTPTISVQIAEIASMRWRGVFKRSKEPRK